MSLPKTHHRGAIGTEVRILYNSTRCSGCFFKKFRVVYEEENISLLAKRLVQIKKQLLLKKM